MGCDSLRGPCGSAHRHAAGGTGVRPGYTAAEGGSIGAYPCESVVEVVLPEQGYFPHYLPGENPFLGEYARDHKIPSEAAMGGAATMYPEYRKRLAELSPP
jgi:hypothetical protein